MRLLRADSRELTAGFEGGSNLRRFAGVSEAGARSRNPERFVRGI